MLIVLPLVDSVMPPTPTRLEAEGAARLSDWLLVPLIENAPFATRLTPFV
jgi:hypothetical protein